MYSLRRNGRVVRLIDTPGFDDSTRSEIDILSEIALWLNMAYTASPRLLLSGLIYLHPINEPKMQGSAKRNLNMFRLLCGDANLNSVVLATTMWEKVTTLDGEKRERELVGTQMFWGSMLDQGSQVLRHQNNTESAFRIIDLIIDSRKTVILDIQKQMVDAHQTLEQTSAGQEQMSGLLKDKKKAEQRLRRNEDELAEVLRKQDAEEAALLQAEQERYKRLIEERKASIAALKMDMEALKREKEAQWRREQEQIAEARRVHEERMNEMRRNLEVLAQQQAAVLAQTETMNKDRIRLEEENRRLHERRQQEQQYMYQSQQDRIRAETLAKERREQADGLAKRNAQAAQALSAAQHEVQRAQMQQQQLAAQRQQMEQQLWQMQQQQAMMQQAQAIKYQKQHSLTDGLGSALTGAAIQYGPGLVSGITNSVVPGLVSAALPVMAGCNVM